MFRSRPNSEQSGGIYVVKPEERKGKAAVGRIWEKEGIKPRMKEWVGDGIPIISMVAYPVPTVVNRHARL